RKPQAEAIAKSRKSRQQPSLKLGKKVRYEIQLQSARDATARARAGQCANCSHRAPHRQTLVSQAFRHHPDAVGSFNRLHQVTMDTLLQNMSGFLTPLMPPVEGADGIGDVHSHLVPQLLRARSSAWVKASDQRTGLHPRRDLAKATQLLTEGADPQQQGQCRLDSAARMRDPAVAVTWPWPACCWRAAPMPTCQEADNDTPLHECRGIRPAGGRLCRPGHAPDQSITRRPRDGLPVTHSVHCVIVCRITVDLSATPPLPRPLLQAAARPPQFKRGPGCHHLVTSVDESGGSAPRTLKFLEAAALGRWNCQLRMVCKQCANARLCRCRGAGLRGWRHPAPLTGQGQGGPQAVKG
uniref:Orange domain-containing protein n=1 Tax=Macrostomum lignano TaxID=282301 RepID=A0A1I8FPU4_9PLAT